MNKPTPVRGFTPIKSWIGLDDEHITLTPWPDYETVVREFFDAASQECWCDYRYGYQTDITSRMLENPETIHTANLAQIKTMLTYCVRGERFGEGHWGIMIRQGYIRRLLERLAELQAEPDPHL